MSIITSRVNSILKLEFMLRHWCELEEARFGTIRGINLSQGVCINASLRPWEDLYKNAVITFNTVSGSFDETYDSMNYPIGGIEEYVTNRHNQYKNPKRKEFAIWMRDNLEWELNHFERVLIKYIRPFYVNRISIWK